MEKVRHTKVGRWLKEKAPDILDVVGDLLPDKGVLGIAKRLVDKDSRFTAGEKDAFNSHLQEIEMSRQENVTRRWEADMSSDVRLAKVIRPAVMITLLGFFMVLTIWDGLDPEFIPKESYVDLLQILMLTVFGAYFAGRTIEKTRK
jgi:hypothetical protein